MGTFKTLAEPLLPVVGLEGFSEPPVEGFFPPPHLRIKPVSDAPGKKYKHALFDGIPQTSCPEGNLIFNQVYFPKEQL
ncbi:hypothetical protein OFC56_37370, partial [Escherichia coli]|nr:hypothetical protein [Escherichia coli]